MLQMKAQYLGIPDKNRDKVRSAVGNIVINVTASYSVVSAVSVDVMICCMW